MERKVFLQKIKVIFILGFLFLLFVAFDVRLKVVTYSIETNKVKESIKIALVTDLHSCKYGKNQKTLIDAIKKKHPDVVLLGGDICDDKIPHRNTEILLKEIANLYPCYYVSGNHEYWSGEVESIKSMIQSYGVTVLEGECKTLIINQQKIKVSGIDDFEVGMYSNGKETIDTQLEACKKTDDEVFHILLAHRPQYIKEYLSFGFDLVLSGHAHGGQWRIPGLLNGVYAPDQGWFPKYAGGFYPFESKSMIVSRGLARESTRVPRIFNRPELVMIDIVPQKTNK